MKTKETIMASILMLVPLQGFADITPTATYTDTNGEEVTTTEDISGEAPLHVAFMANPENVEATATFEWHFRLDGASGSNEVVRYEENTEYDFRESGTTRVTLYVREGEEIVDSASISVIISESHLEMPNAFTPNGDGVNDYYQAKSSSKSLVDFHAYIFNRWGQKLYDWTDWRDEKKGWDGTFNGRPVKDGVYFVLVEARGSDGRVYKIRRDVNLLRNFNEVSGSNE